MSLVALRVPFVRAPMLTLPVVLMIRTVQSRNQGATIRLSKRARSTGRRERSPCRLSGATISTAFLVTVPHVACLCVIRPVKVRLHTRPVRHGAATIIRAVWCRRTTVPFGLRFSVGSPRAGKNPPNTLLPDESETSVVLARLDRPEIPAYFARRIRRTANKSRHSFYIVNFTCDAIVGQLVV